VSFIRILTSEQFSLFQFWFDLREQRPRGRFFARQIRHVYIKRKAMKKFILCSILSALTLPAMAQSTQETETVTISNPALKIELPSKSYRMSSEDFYPFRGKYELSNGQTLSLFERVDGRYAQVSGQPSHKIIAAEHNAFVALDRQLKMRIDIKDNGEVDGELYMLVPSKKQANGEISPEQFVLVAFR
jgi:hypothetical protein